MLEDQINSNFSTLTLPAPCSLLLAPCPLLHALCSLLLAPCSMLLAPCSLPPLRMSSRFAENNKKPLSSTILKGLRPIVPISLKADRNLLAYDIPGKHRIIMLQNLVISCPASHKFPGEIDQLRQSLSRGLPKLISALMLHLPGAALRYCKGHLTSACNSLAARRGK